MHMQPMRVVLNLPHICSTNFDSFIQMLKETIERYRINRDKRLYLHLYPLQQFQGLFMSPFILQTLVAHFTATKGSIYIPAIGKDGDLLPRGTLALSAVAQMATVVHAVVV